MKLFLSKEEKIELVGFNDTKLKLISMTLFSFLFPIILFDISPTCQSAIYLVCVFISLIHIIVFWFVDFWIIIYFRKRYPNIEDYSKRIILQSVVVAIATFLLTLTAAIPELCFGVISEEVQATFFMKFLAGIIVTTIIISFYESAYAFQLFKRGLIKNEELQKRNTQAQLESLKNQVNPHFFFNSLNTLISVIPEDADTAVKFAENLSRVYRYILEIKDRELTTIEEELKSIEAYQYLLSIRFGDHIQFEFNNLESQKDKFIVPLSLQLLIENAIKHNVVSKLRPLTISIGIEGNEIKVCNNLQLKTQHVPSTKIGLDNIRKRYRLLVNKEIRLTRTEEQFCVCLPIISLSEVK